MYSVLALSLPYHCTRQFVLCVYVAGSREKDARNCVICRPYDEFTAAAAAETADDVLSSVWPCVVFASCDEAEKS